MKQKHANTLMFHLVLCFSVILLVVVVLVINSWSFTKQETENATSMAALADPYAQLYADIDMLQESVTGMRRQDELVLNTAELQAAQSSLLNAGYTLMSLLNADDYNRASVDLYRTIENYLEIYASIQPKYDEKKYAEVLSIREEMETIGRWLRGYLAETGETITQRQNALQAKSQRMRARYYRSVLLESCIILVLCIFTILHTAQRFVVPVQVLCKAVKHFRLTDSIEELQRQGIPCKENSLQEIRTLATAIYSMQDTVLGQYVVEKNNEQLRIKLDEEALRITRVEKQLKETQLQALQAQINPHFLFNTLNMIAQMSYLEGAERTTDLLETFSDYFRYNVESFERNVTLAEELANVRGYIALQKERFGERIAYSVEADEAVNGIQVPCLIIQPLVENAISHGLRMKTENGEVRTAVRSIGNGGFEITVADNGCGMDEEALSKLVQRAMQTDQEEDASHRSIGISNVVRRLKIAFGDGVVFHARSAPGEGLCITLRVEGGSAL